MLSSNLPIILRRRPVAAAGGPVPVQNTGLQSIVGDTTGSHTFTNAFPSNVSAGNFAFAAFTWYNGGITTKPTAVTIGGDTATHAFSLQSAFAANYWVCVYFVQSLTGGSRNFAYTAPDSVGAYFEGWACEFSGMAASALDVTVSNGEDAGITRTINSGTLAAAREVVVAAMADLNNFGVADNPQLTTGGFTSVSQGTVGHVGHASGFIITTSAASQGATFTNTAGGACDTIIATFKGT